MRTRALLGQEEIQELESELAALSKQQAEMDKIRQEHSAGRIKSITWCVS